MTFNLGHIAGVPVRANWSAGFIVLWLVMTNSGPGGEDFFYGLGFGIIVMVSILVHELGHAVAGRRLGLRPQEILLHGFGGLCRYDRAPRGLQGVLVSGAGPAAGLALGAIALVLGSTVVGMLPQWAGWVLGTVALINIFWSLFNLLPMLPLDGGHVVFHALEARWGVPSALKVVRYASLGTAALVGFWAFQVGQTFILIVVALVVMQNLPSRRR